MSFFRSAGWVNPKNFEKALPSRKPLTLAEHKVNEAQTQNRSPLAIKAPQSKPGTYCPKCGHAHKIGSTCENSILKLALENDYSGVIHGGSILKAEEGGGGSGIIKPVKTAKITAVPHIPTVATPHVPKVPTMGSTSAPPATPTKSFFKPSMTTTTKPAGAAPTPHVVAPKSVGAAPSITPTREATQKLQAIAPTKPTAALAPPKAIAPVKSPKDEFFSAVDEGAAKHHEAANNYANLAAAHHEITSPAPAGTKGQKIAEWGGSKDAAEGVKNHAYNHYMDNPEAAQAHHEQIKSELISHVQNRGPGSQRATQALKEAGVEAKAAPLRSGQPRRGVAGDIKATGATKVGMRAVPPAAEHPSATQQGTSALQAAPKPTAPAGGGGDEPSPFPEHLKPLQRQTREMSTAESREARGLPAHDPTEPRAKQLAAFQADPKGFVAQALGERASNRPSSPAASAPPKSAQAFAEQSATSAATPRPKKLAQPAGATYARPKQVEPSTEVDQPAVPPQPLPSHLQKLQAMTGPATSKEAIGRAPTQLMSAEQAQRAVGGATAKRGKPVATATPAQQGTVTSGTRTPGARLPRSTQEVSAQQITSDQPAKPRTQQVAAQQIVSDRPDEHQAKRDLAAKESPDPAIRALREHLPEARANRAYVSAFDAARGKGLPGHEATRLAKEAHDNMYAQHGVERAQEHAKNEAAYAAEPVSTPRAQTGKQTAAGKRVGQPQTDTTPPMRAAGQIRPTQDENARPTTPENTAPTQRDIKSPMGTQLGIGPPTQPGKRTIPGMSARGTQLGMGPPLTPPPEAGPPPGGPPGPPPPRPDVTPSSPTLEAPTAPGRAGAPARLPTSSPIQIPFQSGYGMGASVGAGMWTPGGVAQPLAGIAANQVHGFLNPRGAPGTNQPPPRSITNPRAGDKGTEPQFRAPMGGKVGGGGSALLQRSLTARLEQYIQTH